jgi:hypothetical protein
MERWTLCLSVASAVGSVVADPECLRRREGETGDEDRSDDIFFKDKERDQDAMGVMKKDAN